MIDIHNVTTFTRFFGRGIYKFRDVFFVHHIEVGFKKKQASQAFVLLEGQLTRKKLPNLHRFWCLFLHKKPGVHSPKLTAKRR